MMEQVTCYIMNYSEVKELVKQAFNLESFESCLEAPNDTDYYVANILKKELDEWEQEELKEIINNKSCYAYNFYTILTELCNMNYVSSGNYLIQVVW